MIRLVENKHEADLIFKHLKCDTAVMLASSMFTEGFGVNQDFLRLYSAFNNNGKLCAAFVKCNDRVFCLVENLYDEEEIILFLNGFSDFKIFISCEFAHIISRKDYYTCSLMRKASAVCENTDKRIAEIDSQTFTNIIMQGKNRETMIRFLLNNSHLQRHGYINNFALKVSDEIVSIASLYENSESAYLCNVFTPEIHRSKGWAKKLINEITKIEKECHLICSEDISPLYERCGFQSYAKWTEFLY